MTVFVKICGLRDAADVAAVVEAGANAVGFVFADSVRRVTPQQARAAALELPKEVQRVAVMRHPSNDQCRAVLDEFEPDVVQADAEDFAGLDIPDSIGRWPVIREGSADTDFPEVFLYEGSNSGRGETVDWASAASIAGRGCMILAGGLDPMNVATAIRTIRPWGVDVSSGVESSRGRKDHELIKRFVRAVRAAEKEL